MIKKIILAEDDLLDKELAINTIKSINIQNEIIHFEDGQAVLDYLSELSNANDIALILLDLKMPKLNGIQTLKIIKSNINTRNIPVVMLSSSKERNDIAECYRWGVNSYVVKPLDISVYQNNIKQLANYWYNINYFNN